MIPRRLFPALTAALDETPVVALLGPRQVGKTTLALEVAESRPAIYLDLESEADRAKLAEPELYLAQHADKLVILDEIQRTPQLFRSLRGLIDTGRRRGQGQGKSNGRFLVLGSASIDLLKQSSETLAGRIRYLELAPVDAGEVDRDRLDALWLRGGFPESLLADSDAASLRWRGDFIRTYLERDIPQLGPRIAAETLRRFWTMLSHQQGALLNAAVLARALAVDGKTVAAYLDLLVDLLLVRRLAPWHGNVKKRLVKSPKIYVRDSGLVHALLGIGDHEALLAHPVAGGSWEGLAIESLIGAAPAGTEAYFFRTAVGAEIDLLLQRPGERKPWAIEIKRGLAPKLERGYHAACDTVKPLRRRVVYGGVERFPLAEDVEAVSLPDLCEELADV
ncbi:MAG: ATP-binding protein [Gammaproteobacteria bacterium]|nr:ATP-binding protein [Gammaproteobacteria bacterium]